MGFDVIFVNKKSIKDLATNILLSVQYVLEIVKVKPFW